VARLRGAPSSSGRGARTGGAAAGSAAGRPVPGGPDRVAARRARTVRSSRRTSATRRPTSATTSASRSRRTTGCSTICSTRSRRRPGPVAPARPDGTEARRISERRWRSSGSRSPGAQGGRPRTQRARRECDRADGRMHARRCPSRPARARTTSSSAPPHRPKDATVRVASAAAGLSVATTARCCDVRFFTGVGHLAPARHTSCAPILDRTLLRPGSLRGDARDLADRAGHARRRGERRSDSPNRRWCSVRSRRPRSRRPTRRSDRSTRLRAALGRSRPGPFLEPLPALPLRHGHPARDLDAIGPRFHARSLTRPAGRGPRRVRAACGAPAWAPGSDPRAASRAAPGSMPARGRCL